MHLSVYFNRKMLKRKCAMQEALRLGYLSTTKNE